MRPTNAPAILIYALIAVNVLRTANAAVRRRKRNKLPILKTPE